MFRVGPRRVFEELLACGAKPVESGCLIILLPWRLLEWLSLPRSSIPLQKAVSKQVPGLGVEVTRSSYLHSIQIVCQLRLGDAFHFRASRKAFILGKACQS